MRDGGAWGIWLKSDGYYEGSYVALTLLLVSEMFPGTKYMAEVELRRLRVSEGSLCILAKIIADSDE